MATPRFGSATSYFIPQATGQVCGAIRKPGKFRLMEYTQLVSSNRKDASGKPVCLFFTIDPDAPARVVTDQEYAWEDGDIAPEGAGNLSNFTPTEVRMFRRAYPYRVGEQAADTADVIPVMAINRAEALQIAMTNKTQRVCTLIDTASNWGNNTGDCDTINGGRGKWASASATEGSPNYLAIKRSLTAAAQTVELATNSVLGLEDLVTVISPVLAMDGANSGEITDYLKGSVYSKMVQEGKERGTNSHYGFPDYYAGMKVIVENASRVSERPNSAGTAATVNRAFVKDPTKAVLLSRKGGIDGVEGAPSFSTLQIFYYKYEMAVEERFDSWNKRHDGRVVDQFKEVLAYNRGGYLITGCR